MKLSTIIGDDLKAHYLAFVIDEASRAQLLKLIAPKYEKKVCHHVTLKFDLSKGLTDKERDMLGQSIDVLLMDVRDDGKGVQALGVVVNGETKRPDGSFYHITHSLSPDRKLVDSNKLKDSLGAVVKGVVQIKGVVYLVKK